MDFHIIHESIIYCLTADNLHKAFLKRNYYILYKFSTFLLVVDSIPPDTVFFSHSPATQIFTKCAAVNCNALTYSGVKHVLLGSWCVPKPPLTFTSLALIGSHYQGHVILCFVQICGWLFKCCEVFTVWLTELMSRVCSQQHVPMLTLILINPHYPYTVSPMEPRVKMLRTQSSPSPFGPNLQQLIN